MPKGVSSSNQKSVLDRVAKLVVPAGSKVYPGTQSSELPEGIFLPDGIRIRTERGVELRFIYDGARVSETVRGKPTVAFVREVARKRERIQQLIGLGKFGQAEYEEEFPDTQRFRDVEVEEKRPVTVGEALLDWYYSRVGTVGPNTDEDEIKAIYNQLMPLQPPKGVFKDSDYLKPRPDYKPPESWTRSRYQGGPVRPVDVSNTKILAHLPIHLMTDLAINKMRELLLQTVGIKRVNNLMGPLRGALERQATLGNIARNPFELVRPLKNTDVDIQEGGDPQKRQTLEDLNAPLPSLDTNEFRKGEGEVDPFSESEVLSILSKLDAAMANQMTFAFWSGLRTGETIALRTNDIDFKNERILVRRSVSRGILKSTKTNKQRWVSLLPPAKEAIIAQIRLLGAPGGWVFPNPFTKQRWTNDSKITKRWRKALAIAGVRYRKPYQTRHTFASMMLSAGENVMYVAGQMGHADWSMLVKVYGHWLPSGGVTQAGDLVTKANTKNWGALLAIMEERSQIAPQLDDYEGDGEDDGTELGDEIEQLV